MKRILLLAALMTACGTEAGKTGPAALTPSAAPQDGKDGAQGAKGEKGDVGPQGPQGPQGSQGEKGDKGDAGALGEKGETGAAGADGATGATGAVGAAGFTLNVVNHDGTVIGQYAGMDHTGSTYFVISGTRRFQILAPVGSAVIGMPVYYADVNCTGEARSFDSGEQFGNVVAMPDGTYTRFTGKDLGSFLYKSVYSSSGCQASGGSRIPHSWSLTPTTVPTVDRAEIQE